jgi:hypothetical protein
VGGWGWWWPWPWPVVVTVAVTGEPLLSPRAKEGDKLGYRVFHSFIHQQLLLSARKKKGNQGARATLPACDFLHKSRARFIQPGQTESKSPHNVKVLAVAVRVRIVVQGGRGVTVQYSAWSNGNGNGRRCSTGRSN